MERTYLLISNNPRFQTERPGGVAFKFVKTGSMDVLIACRDLLHQGWHLMNSPVYGNFRPYQQPFRTLLLRAPAVDRALDEYGLQLLDGALDIYTNCGKEHVTPDSCHPRFVDDYQTIDWELLQETFIKCGLRR